MRTIETVKTNVRSGGEASLQITSYNEQHTNKLIGSTLSLAPSGTAFNNILTFKLPESYNALVIYCSGMHRAGGQVNPYYSTHVLLCWATEGMVFMKFDEAMTPAELNQFNSFIKSSDSLSVVDTDRKIIYYAECTSYEHFELHKDPSWVYKKTSINHLLEYIIKMIGMEELDARAEAEAEERLRLEAEKTPPTETSTPEA